MIMSIYVIACVCSTAAVGGFSYNPTDFIRYVTRMLCTIHNKDIYAIEVVAKQGAYQQQQRRGSALYTVKTSKIGRAMATRHFECWTYLKQTACGSKGEKALQESPDVTHSIVIASRSLPWS